MGFKSPHIDTPQAPPPPPTPATIYKAPKVTQPNLGGTFLTASMPGGPPVTKPKKSLLGQ